MNILLCDFHKTEKGHWKCVKCDFVYNESFPDAPQKACGISPETMRLMDIARLSFHLPDIAPILSRLAELTHHPEIIDQPNSYARAAQRWAAGIPGEFEPFETRDDSEVEFIQALCRENVCGKHQDGVCKPSCGSGMIIEVKARMASETCPWAWSRW